MALLRKTLFVFLCAGIVFNLHAQDPALKFEHISLEEGLSQSLISDILQDRQGYMWFGTQEGLNKFDGHRFTIYKYQPGDSTSLSENYVNAVYEDRSGTLWIGTAGGGLCRFDRSTKRFTPFRNNPKDESSLSHNVVTTIYEDRHGVLWVGTRAGGLNKLVLRPDSSSNTDDSARGLAQNQFTHYRRDESDKNAISGNNITAILEDRSGRLWIGTAYAGLNEFDRDKNIFKHYCHDPKNPLSLSSNSIGVIYEDRAGDLWIGTTGGLNHFDPEKNIFTVYKHDPKDPHSLSSNAVTSICEDVALDDAAGKLLWIGTTEGGLAAFDLTKKTFVNYRHDPGNASTISSNTVLKVYTDRSGLLWVGTGDNGIDKVDRKPKKFKHFTREPGKPNSIGNALIWSLYEERPGVLWIGRNNGLDRFEMRGKAFRHYENSAAWPKGMSHSHVFAICPDPDPRSNNLWIGTSRGLDKFDKISQKFSHYHDENPAKANGLPNAAIFFIHPDQHGAIWVGTAVGLHKLDRTHRAAIRYSLNVESNATTNWIKAVCEADDRFMWVGSRSGLILFDRQTENFLTYHSHHSDTTGLSHHDIYSLYQDPDGTLWIATAGGGLNRLTRDEAARAKSALIARAETPGDTLKGRNDCPQLRFKHFTEKDGLCNNNIYGILADQRRRLWLSTNRGISCFDPSSETFKNYDLNDGLQSYEFNQGALHEGKSGAMFFGGINGFNTFFPDSIMDNPFVPPIVITEFKKFDKAVPFDQNSAQRKEIMLSYADNFFSFEFVALDYTNPLKNQFAYKLEGFDADWIYCGSRRYTSYTNLDPGRYVFRVKGSNSDGVWNEAGASAKLYIEPPFWKSWWFAMVATAVFMFSALGFHERRVKQKIRRALEMENVRMRENERVRKQVADDFHDELGQKLTNMTLLTEILKRNLCNISLQNAAYLDKIRETSKNLSNGVRNFIWALDPQQDSLYDLAIYLKDFGDEIFDKSGIHFRTKGISGELESVKLPMNWRRHLALLFKEGMNNVLKHASCHNVTLEMALKHDCLIIALADDGKGFNGNGNFNGNGSSNGNGHSNGYHDADHSGLNGESQRGMTSMSSRASKLQGRIKVISNVGAGTKIQFTGHLPERVIEHDYSLNS